MTNSVIRICNFVHYIFREGGYQYSDQFSLLLFSLFMVGVGVQREIVPTVFFPEHFPNKVTFVELSGTYYVGKDLPVFHLKETCSP